jgi:hypothetical protein
MASIDALERAARPPRWPAVAAAGALAVVAGVAFASRAAPRASIAPPPAVAVGACATNAACVASHGGAPFVCRPDHTCAALASEDCTPRFEPGDLEAEDTVWLGELLPTRDASSKGFASMNAEAADFARREIARTTGAQRLRRVALVECDDSVDVRRAAHHLVDDVRVPAVLGFRSGQEAIDLAGSLLVNEGVAAVATLTSNPLVTRTPQPPEGPRLVWRTTCSFDAVGQAIARMIEGVLEPRRPAGTSRVTLAREESPGAVSFGDRFFRQLRFNGRTALENGEAYREVTFASAPGDDVDRVAARVEATKPTFLVLQGSASFVPRLIERVEARLAGEKEKPTYVWAAGAAEYLNDFIGRDAGRRRRVFAVNSVANEPTNARFVIRYNAEHAQPVTRVANGGVTYDAVYLLAYAAFAQGGGAVSGASLSRAIGRLVGPGRVIEVGPSDLFDGVSALATGAPIDLAGTATSLDFDLASGEPYADITLGCAGVDARGAAAGDHVFSGVTYRVQGDRLEGELHCP